MSSDTPLGSKSVFFDAELNPQGMAPSGFKNRRVPLKYPETVNASLSTSQIPLPKEPLPKFFKFYRPIESSYSAEEQVKQQADVTTLVPSSVARKRGKNQEKHQPQGSTKRVRLEDVD